MSADDLYDPLGLEEPARQRVSRDLPWAAIAVGGMGLLAVGLVTFSVVTDNGLGGRSYADATIERPRSDVPALPPPPAAANSPAVTGSVPPRASAASVETESGVKVVRQGGADTPGALIISVPQDSIGVQLAPAPDERLVENGRYGALPRIADDGARPSEIYARPLVTSPGLKPNAPRVAIVVGGMGLNPTTTATAIDTLIGDVTIGFAPYGQDLTAQVARARDAGHEIVLQAPMDPYDKKDVPGPHTLASGAEPAKNIDHLHWLMSRMTGYVGVANFLGAKFTSREADLAPVMREIAGRGLLYLDDGTSPQSIAVPLAAAAGVPSGRADVVLDANPSPAGLESALGRLETIARQKGSAIGYAAGQPGAIEAIARFARGLEKRGVALVPLSTLAGRPSAPSAELNR